MKRILLLLAAASLAQLAFAHEYPLQFTPNAGYQGLVIAGYSFSGSNVVGTCSYHTVHSGSGKGGGYKSTTTYYNQTCTWDHYGNLLSLVSGAPVAPSPLYTSGTVTVYAQDSSGDTTGVDTALPNRGFINTLGSHFTWTTSNAHAVLQPQMVFTIPVTLVSDGDIPLGITAVTAGASLAKTSIVANTCIGEIAVGATCMVTVRYDDTRLSSPSGLAYDTLTVSVVSDSPASPNFVQSYTLVVKVPVDDGLLP